MKALTAVLLILLPTAQSGAAHIGDRVIYIPHVSADDLAYIEQDGNIDDWEELLGEPTLTPFDFNPFYHQALTSYADTILPIWIFRSGSHGRTAANSTSPSKTADYLCRNYDDPTSHYFSDHVVLEVDGNHSGVYAFLGGAEADLRNAKKVKADPQVLPGPLGRTRSSRRARCQRSLPLPVAGRAVNPGPQDAGAGIGDTRKLTLLR